jgi:membrane protein implicated in regulation of membrane protease activity
MAWWLWILVGLALLGLEILTPGGFYVLFFGVGALVVGALTAVGYSGPVWSQWLLFSVISIVTLALFRKPVLRLVDDRAPAPAMDTLEGEVAVLLDDLAVGTIGKAELRGTVWTAQNAGDRPLARGQRARVSAVDGLTLKLRPE